MVNPSFAWEWLQQLGGALAPRSYGATSVTGTAENPVSAGPPPLRGSASFRELDDSAAQRYPGDLGEQPVELPRSTVVCALSGEAAVGGPELWNASDDIAYVQSPTPATPNWKSSPLAIEPLTLMDDPSRIASPGWALKLSQALDAAMTAQTPFGPASSG